MSNTIVISRLTLTVNQALELGQVYQDDTKYVISGVVVHNLYLNSGDLGVLEEPIPIVVDLPEGMGGARFPVANLALLEVDVNNSVIGIYKTKPGVRLASVSVHFKPAKD